MDIRIDGVRPILDRLQKLGKQGISVINTSSREAMVPTLTHARTLVPVRTGNLKAAMGISRRTKVGTGEVEVTIGIRKDYTVKNSEGVRTKVRHRDASPRTRPHPLLYARYIETGEHPRRPPARPRRFMAGAWEQTAPTIPDRMAAALRRRLGL